MICAKASDFGSNKKFMHDLITHEGNTIFLKKTQLVQVTINIDTFTQTFLFL